MSTSSVTNVKKNRWTSRKRRVKKSLSRSPLTRLTVYRHSKHITEQIDDPETGKTIVTVTTNSKVVMGGVTSTGNIAAAKLVGAAIAEAAKAKQISEVVFNRNGFLYHGRVKALADAAREAGLKF